jgi:hypothetical protein
MHWAWSDLVPNINPPLPVLPPSAIVRLNYSSGADQQYRDKFRTQKSLQRNLVFPHRLSHPTLPQVRHPGNGDYTYALQDLNSHVEISTKDIGPIRTGIGSVLK